MRQLGQIAPSDAWRRSKPVANGNCDPTSLPVDGRPASDGDLAKDQGLSAVPLEFQVKLDLAGWYAIWIAVVYPKNLTEGGFWGNRSVPRQDSERGRDCCFAAQGGRTGDFEMGLNQISRSRRPIPWCSTCGRGGGLLPLFFGHARRPSRLSQMAMKSKARGEGDV